MNYESRDRNIEQGFFLVIILIIFFRETYLIILAF